MNHLGLRAIAALGVGVLLGACATAQPGTSATGGELPSFSADPSAAASTAAETGALCALVPIDQIELALGGQPDAGQGDDDSVFGGQSCRFTLDDEHVVDVTLDEKSREQWLEEIETVGLNDEAVEGVGDEAYRAAGTALGGPGARFTAWADGRDVGVTIYSDVDQEVSFAAAEAIAIAVLASAP